MDKIEVFSKLNEKRVGCIFIFDKYKKRHYKEDFETFVAYQTKRNMVGGLDSRFYFNIKEFKPIPFDYFREKVVYYFSRIVFYLLRQHPKYLISNRLNLQIKLLCIKGRSYYFEYDDKASDPENACYYGAGFWFIQTIAAPLFYLKHIDYNYILRFFLHELGHHIDYQTKEIVVFDKQQA